METVRASDYHDVVQVGEPRISPDGQRVAFVRKVPDGDDAYEATVYVVPVGGGPPRRFTVAEGVDSCPRWSPSGDRLAFVSTRGGDDDRSQVWVLPTDGGEARQVTHVVGGASDLAWSPDGTRIAFVQRVTEDDREAGRDLSLGDGDRDPEDPDPRVIDRLVYRSKGGYFDGRRSHVYVVDLGDASWSGDRPAGKTGAPDSEDTEVRRLTRGDYDFSGPEWADESTLYYGVKRTGDPDDNVIVDVAEYDFDAGEEVGTVVQTAGWGATLAATGDGRLAYATTDEDEPTLRGTDIEVLDRETGEVTTPTASLDRTLATSPVAHWPAGVPEWGPDGDDLFFLTPDEGDVTLWRAPGDATADPERVVSGREVYGASVGDDAVAFVAGEWDHPGDAFVTTPRGAETRRLTRVNSDYLDDRAISRPEEVRFEGGDGDEIQGWVLTPPDFDGAAWNAAEQSSGDEPRDEGTYPLAVEIHGGPHSMWGTSRTMWQEFQLLAARGYVVFWCNPRGSTGYGEEFMAAIGDGQWGPPAYDDVMAGVDEVASRPYVDEDNLFVTGGSYGGYLTAWIVGHTDRFAGAVAQRGVYELTGFYGSTDAFKLLEWDFDATPPADAAFLWEQSPAAYADEVDTPTLLIHADEDYRVPVGAAELLFRTYRKHGVETRLVRYPREGHELSRSGEPAHVVDRLERLVRWFDGYSDHHDVPTALERGDEGLSAGDGDDDEDGTDDGTNGEDEE